MGLTITADVLAGTSIESAIKDGQTLSEKLGVSIEFKFNGVKIWCHAPFVEIDKGVEKYHNALKSDTEYSKFICV